MLPIGVGQLLVHFLFLILLVHFFGCIYIMGLFVGNLARLPWKKMLPENLMKSAWLGKLGVSLFGWKPMPEH
jgi:hypothetical protein